MYCAKKSYIEPVSDLMVFMPGDELLQDFPLADSTAHGSPGPARRPYISSGGLGQSTF